MTCADFSHLLIRGPGATHAEFAALVRHARECGECRCILMMRAEAMTRQMSDDELDAKIGQAARFVEECNADPEC